jgi:hypothetical protein
MLNTKYVWQNAIGRLYSVALLGLLVIGAMLGASCGGGSEAASIPAPSPSANVSSDDVEKSLKFDSRVQDFDTDGDKLTVNVNEHWVSSPVGMQERALKKWFADWEGARASDNGGKPPKGVTVVVTYDGNAVAKATVDKGIEFLEKSKATQES